MYISISKLLEKHGFDYSSGKFSVKLEDKKNKIKWFDFETSNLLSSHPVFKDEFNSRNASLPGLIVDFKAEDINKNYWIKRVHNDELVMDSELKEHPNVFNMEL